MRWARGKQFHMILTILLIIGDNFTTSTRFYISVFCKRRAEFRILWMAKQCNCRLRLRPIGISHTKCLLFGGRICRMQILLTRRRPPQVNLSFDNKTPEWVSSGVKSAIQEPRVKNEEELWAAECLEQFTRQHAEDDEKWMRKWTWTRRGCDCIFIVGSGTLILFLKLWKIMKSDKHSTVHWTIKTYFRDIFGFIPFFALHPAWVATLISRSGDSANGKYA